MNRTDRFYLVAAYDVGIGQDSDTVLYIQKFPGGSFLEMSSVGGVVTCHNYRRFWISWMDGAGGREIRLGKNKVPKDVQVTV